MKTILPVPKIDMNASLTVPMDKSTNYDTGVTPKNKYLYILGIFGFAGIILSTCVIFYFYLTGFKGKSEDKNVVVLESAAIEEVLPIFNRSNITFEVLNGSGVAGAAGAAGIKIQDLGFKIIKTGNTQTTKGNKLYLNKNVQEFSNQIIADLPVFNISTVSGELTEGTVSARLILGK